MIPLIQTNKWQVRARPEDLEKDDEKGEEKELAKVEGDSVEAQAANELIKGMVICPSIGSPPINNKILIMVVCFPLMNW